jgi:hypothetical protein
MSQAHTAMLRKMPPLGEKIYVHSLAGKKECDGKRGVVIGYDGMTQRIQLQIYKDDGNKLAQGAFKIANVWWPKGSGLFWIPYEDGSVRASVQRKRAA